MLCNLTQTYHVLQIKYSMFNWQLVNIQVNESMKTYTQPKSGITKHVFSSIQRNIPKYYAKDNQHRTHSITPSQILLKLLSPSTQKLIFLFLLQKCLNVFHTTLMLLLWPVERSPNWLTLEQPHSMNEISFVNRKSMIDSLGKSHKITSLDVNTNPLVSFGSDVEKTRT